MRSARLATLLMAFCAPGAREAAFAQVQEKVSADATFVDSRYLLRSLSELGPARTTVLVFVAPDCPLARRSLALLVDMERELCERDVRFLGRDPSGDACVIEINVAGLAV